MDSCTAAKKRLEEKKREKKKRLNACDVDIL